MAMNRGLDPSRASGDDHSGADVPGVDAPAAVVQGADVPGVDVDVQTAFVRTVVDEWVRGGLTHAVVAPGSRNTPLSMALLGNGRVHVHVHVDERSAGFLALGLTKATGRPTVVVCTSGSATANLHPAVVEAHHGQVALLVCTADRPWELHDTGAPQTMRQHGLYGDAVRWASDVPVAAWSARSAWRPLAARALIEATGGLGSAAGPVHLNLAFREPLLPTGAPAPVIEGRADDAPWIVSAPIGARRAEAAGGGFGARPLVSRGVLVLGAGADRWLAEADIERCIARTGWPVLADALSGLRFPGPGVIAAYEALVRAPVFADHHRPELVVRVGAPLTSKLTTQWLAEVPHIVVDPAAAWVDPTRSAVERVVDDPADFLSSLALRPDPSSGESWGASWIASDTTARSAIDDAITGFGDDPFEGRVARDVAEAVPDGATLVVASSMPVRDLEWFMKPRRSLRIMANRGMNGIDGFVATMVGVALGSPGTPTVGLCGDLAFLHDVNGLIGVRRRGVDVVLVVIDNDGGGIFSFLPQAAIDDQAMFETLWGTPHGVDLAALAAAHGVPATIASGAQDVGVAVTAAMAAGGVRLVLVRTDRRRNVEQHRAVWQAVDQRLGENAVRSSTSTSATASSIASSPESKAATRRSLQKS